MDFQDLQPADLKGYADFDNHETVRRVTDPGTGLTGYIAIHNTAIGPSLGGCRMTTYAAERDAVHDVLRLSRGMTYKNALAGLPLGGGKSVIIGDPYKDKTPAMISAMAEGIQSLEGRYISAEDSGIAVKDIALMADKTPYVAGFQDGVSEGIGGDPSPFTAYGLYSGMKAAAQKIFNTSSMDGLTVAIQGMGAVGRELTRLLHKDGASLIVTDVRQNVLDEARERYDRITIVRPDEIFDAKAHIFAPCALGAQLNDETVTRLNVSIVAGAANNQLARPEHENQLAARDILYVPDYVINAGGVIAIAYEYLMRTGQNPFPHPLSKETMTAHIGRIEQTLKKIFDIADSEKRLPGRIADEMAEVIFKAEDAAFNPELSSSIGQDGGKTAAR